MKHEIRLHPSVSVIVERLGKLVSVQKVVAGHVVFGELLEPAQALQISECLELEAVGADQFGKAMGRNSAAFAAGVKPCSDIAGGDA